MNLDINTAKGQESLLHERELQAYVSKSWDVQLIETPKERISKCDGFLVRDGQLLALFETKCRYDMTYSDLLDRGSWLITHEKVEACRKLSEDLRIPFLGFLYLRPKHSTERLMLFWKITDENGQYLFDMEISKQETQMTINGGSISRVNAYLPVEKCMIIKPTVKA